MRFHGMEALEDRGAWLSDAVTTVRPILPSRRGILAAALAHGKREGLPSSGNTADARVDHALLRTQDQHWP